MSPDVIQRWIRERKEFTETVEERELGHGGERIVAKWNVTNEVYSVFYAGARLLMLDRYSDRWFARNRSAFKRGVVCDAIFGAVPEAELADSAFMFNLAIAGSLVAAVDYRLTGERYGVPDMNSFTAAEAINHVLRTAQPI